MASVGPSRRFCPSSRMAISSMIRPTHRRWAPSRGKPASEGPLALKRELREIDGRLAGLEKNLAQAETEAAALARNIEELAAQLEARSEERRIAESDPANQGAALK